MVNVTESNITVSEARVILNTPRVVVHTQPPPGSSRLPTAAFTVEHTRTGIPVTLIWVPYVLFSVILIGLMLTSFYRFHRKHGHKYRRRRAEAESRQASAAEAAASQQLQQDQAQGATLPPNGGVNMRVPIETPAPSYSQPPPIVPQPGSSIFNYDSYFIHTNPTTSHDTEERDHHSNPSGNYHHGNTTSRDYHGNRDYPHRNRDRDRDYRHGERDRDYRSRDYHQPGNPSATRGGGGGESHGSRAKSSSKPSTSAGASSSKRHRRPLVFTSNVNGSMVDVRCGESDSLKTFRPLPPSEASEQPSSIWTLPYKKSTILRPPYSGKYRSDDIEDDEVFLLHQTKL